MLSYPHNLFELDHKNILCDPTNNGCFVTFIGNTTNYMKRKKTFVETLKLSKPVYEDYCLSYTCVTTSYPIHVSIQRLLEDN